MKQANVTVRLEKHGHDVVKTLVTPAEVALLVAEHHINAGGNPIVASEDAPDVVRADVDEVARLRELYGHIKVKALYPGLKPTLPVSFKEAGELGLSTTMPGSKLLVKTG